jgi:hypothetical protein
MCYMLAMVAMRLVSALFILCLALDFAIPTTPGAVQFPDESVDAAKASRPGTACEAVDGAVRQPVPVEPLVVFDTSSASIETTSHRRTVNPAARRVPGRASPIETPEDHS